MLNKTNGTGQATSQPQDIKNSFKTMAVGGLAVVVIGGLAQLFFPWWSIAVVAFLVGFVVNESAGKSMVYGTLAMTVLWSLYAAFLNNANEGLIGSSIAQMIGTNSGLLMVYTGLIGGLVSGMFAMSGSLLRKMI